MYDKDTLVSEVSSNDLSNTAIDKLIKSGFIRLSDFENKYFPDIYRIISFDQAKNLLKILNTISVHIKFKEPVLGESEWKTFLEGIINNGIVSWKEAALAVLGELNPPQVGTQVASKDSFKKKFPKKETMKNVMYWLYSQKGKCAECGTKLYLEADHIIPKEEFEKNHRSVEDADTLDNLQLLCKRCNVIKRPSHKLGGMSFAPAQSVLIWILLKERPTNKQLFYNLCREYGLTMASVRFDEAWAFAIWLSKEGKYIIQE